MRLFLYYALHTVKNQVRKLFKSWVLVFILICALMGGVIGYSAGSLSELAEEVQAVQGEALPEEAEAPSLTELLGVEPPALAELVLGLVLLLILFFEAFNAEKSGSSIFLPADAALLFPSPLKPQSVLLFRLVSQLGLGLVLGLMIPLELSALSPLIPLPLSLRLMMLPVWFLTLALGKLLQMLLFLLCVRHPRLRANLRRGLLLLLGLLAAGLILFWRQSGLGFLQAAAAFFNAPASRFVPLWGWLKGAGFLMAEGETLGALGLLAAAAAGCALLFFLVWRIKADFYEEALARSEETAALQARVREESGITARRRKERPDRLRRDGLRGEGASVFFHKTLYNRFRFAHLGFLSKTMETYLVLAAAVALLFRFVWKQEAGELPVALLLAFCVFFRALANPLPRDVRSELFRLAPDSAWAKLFFSLLGGTVSCLLDVLPALLLGTLLAGGKLLLVPAWLFFIASVDLLSTCAGSFIALSLPASLGRGLRQAVQIIFLYFGWLPDALILAVGIIFGHTGAAVLLAGLLNLALGTVFFALSPLFLEPKGGREPRMDTPFFDLRIAKRSFSRAGFALFTTLAGYLLLQSLLVLALQVLWPGYQSVSWSFWLCTLLPLYLIAIPVGVLILRGVPKTPLPDKRLGPARLGMAFLICVCPMYVGNLVGMGVNALVQSVLRLPSSNPLDAVVPETSLPLRVLFMVILAPLMEEYLFRKQLISRLHKYGGRTAVCLSAAAFGLFHGNLSQLFYAFALGLVFGVVYLKTGRLRYTVLLHAVVNFLGSVVAPWLLEHAGLNALDAVDLTDPEALLSLMNPGFLLMGLYGFLMLAMAVAGLVFLCMQARRLRFDPEPLPLPRGQRVRTAWLNLGMLLFLAACAGMIVLSLFQ